MTTSVVNLLYILFISFVFSILTFFDISTSEGQSPTPTTTPCIGGRYGNDVRACRGGSDHGKFCCQNSDCESQLCTRGGHPKYCATYWTCQVSGRPCISNADCEPEWSTDKDDYCKRFKILQHTPCDVDADCGICSGLNEGKGCTTDDDDTETGCPGAGGCVFDHAYASCIPGFMQCESDHGSGEHINRETGEGLPYDTFADYKIGGDGIWVDDNQSRIRTPSDLEPYAVAWEGETAGGRLYTYDGNRIQVREGLSWLTSSSDADYVIGQFDVIGDLWKRMPSDITLGEIDFAAPNLLGKGNLVNEIDLTTNHSVVREDVDLYVVEEKAVRIWRGNNISTNSSANYILGYDNLNTLDVNDNLSVFGRKRFDKAQGIAVQNRCQEGSSLNEFGPCSTNSECGDGECWVTIAVADNGFNRVLVYFERDIIANNIAASYVIGQPDFATTTENTGGIGNDTLSLPRDVAFDGGGNLWVLDGGNKRVLRFDKDLSDGMAANGILGQANYTTGSEQSVAANTLSPYTRSIDFGDDYTPLSGGDKTYSLALVDVDWKRVLVWSDLSSGTITNPNADYVVGQTNFTNIGGEGLGSACETFAKPMSVFFGDNNGIWVADREHNRQAFFPGPITANATIPDIIHGQEDCTVSGQLRSASSFTTDPYYNNGGIAFIPYTVSLHEDGICAADTDSNRVLCWDDHRVAETTPRKLADIVIGQSGFDTPNQLPGTSQYDLNGPSLIGYLAAGNKKGLVIADTGNHRVVLVERSGTSSREWNATNESFDAVWGQGTSFTEYSTSTNSDPPTATSLNSPYSARASQDTEYGGGNLFVADTNNGRILVYCNVADSLCTNPADNTTCICRSSLNNHLDNTADAVLGKPDFVTGLNNGVGVDDCTTPTASTLCNPFDVIDDPRNKRIIVADSPLEGIYRQCGYNAASNAGGSCDDDSDCGSTSGACRYQRGGRILIYSYADTKLTNGEAAAAVLGNPSGSFTTYAGSTYGYCVGGDDAGDLCNYSNYHQEGESGELSKTCIAGTTNIHEGCSVDADCGTGGKCGCGGTGAWCNWKKTGGLAHSLAYYPESDRLYSTRGSQLVEWRGPFTSGMEFNRIVGGDTPAYFGAGYISCQTNIHEAGIEVNESGDLYGMNGGIEKLAGIYGWNSLAVDVGATATPTRTPIPPTPTITRTNTMTPTQTSTPTTGTPVNHAMLFFRGSLVSGSILSYWSAYSSEDFNQHDYILPISGRIEDLRVSCAGNITNGNQAFAVYVDGESINQLSCTINTGSSSCRSAGGTEETADGSVPFTTTDRFRLLTFNDTTLANHNFDCTATVTIKKSDGGEYPSIVTWGSATNVLPSGTRYCGPSDVTASPALCFDSDQERAAFVVPSAGTLAGLSIAYDAPLASGKSETFTVLNVTDATTSNLTLAMSAGESEKVTTTCSSNCAVGAGDLIVVRATGTFDSRIRTMSLLIDGVGTIIPSMSDQRSETTTYGGPLKRLNSLDPYYGATLTSRKGVFKNMFADINTVPSADFDVELCVGTSFPPVCSGALKCTIQTTDISCSETVDTITAEDNTWFMYKVTSQGDTLDPGSAYVHVVSEFDYVAESTPTMTGTATPAPTNTPTPTFTYTRTPTRTFTKTATPTPTNTMAPPIFYFVDGCGC